MEPQSYQQQHEDNGNNVGGGGNGGGSKSTFLCRQSSSRWIPTTDQIRILRDLYYNCGVRSPSAEQIQKISARLRQYGKIEGKNVFYWFQNHKARERQKKRLTVDITSSKYSNGMLSPGVSAGCTSPGVCCVGQVGSHGCVGTALMERNCMEYSLSGGLSAGSSMVEGSMGWVGVEPTATPSLYFHQQRSPYYYGQELQHQCHEQQPQQGGEEASAPPQIETLPLFPVHSEPHQEEEGYGGRGPANSHEWLGKAHPPLTGHFPPTFYQDQPQHQQEEEDQRHYGVYDEDGSIINIGGASLELSLNSYGSLPGGPT